MADFNVSLSEPGLSGAQPVAPVQKHVSRFENPYVELGTNLTKIFLQNREQAKREEALATKNRIIGDFVKEQNALSEAGKQGLPSDQVLARSRANFAKYSANYPELVGEFTSTNKSLLENTELGLSEQTEKMMIDERKNLRSDFIKSGGILPAGASPEYEALALSNFQKRRQETTAFDMQVKMATEQRAQAGADRSQIDWEMKQRSVQMLSNIGSSQLPVTQQFIGDAVSKARKGDVAGATADINMYFSNVEGAIAAASATNPEMASGWRTVFQNMKEAALKAVDGKTEQDALDNQLKALITKGKLIALQDPNMLGATVSSQLLGGNLPEMFWTSNNAAREALIRIGATFGGDQPQVVGNPVTERVAYQVLEHNLKLLDSGKLSDAEATSQQVSNAANNVLTQVNRAAQTGISPEKLKPAADFIASPTYARMVEKNLISKEAAQGAKQAFELTYERGISKGISANLEKPVLTKGILSPYQEEVTAGQLVDFQWSGAGVKIAEAKAPQYFNYLDQGKMDNVIISLKNSEKAINQIVKMGAHLEGHTDYAKYWEENKFRILPTYYPDPEVVKAGQVYEMDGKKFKYTGGVPWRNKSFWVEEKGSE